MNWKTEAVEKLRRYDAVRRSVINIGQEIARLKAEYTAIGAGMPELLPGSRDVRKREDRLMNNLVYRQELQQALTQAQQWMETVNRALAGLDPEERFVLHQMYICPPNDAVGHLCEKLEVEKSSIYRRRDKALQKFTVAMYGITESN